MDNLKETKKRLFLAIGTRITVLGRDSMGVSYWDLKYDVGTSTLENKS